MKKNLPERFKLKPKNHNAKWTDLERDLLLTMYAAGKDEHHVAQVLERRVGACRAQVYQYLKVSFTLRHKWFKKSNRIYKVYGEQEQKAHHMIGWNHRSK